ncbi:GNAT family N-acetyltransferase [Yoonia sp. SS1-5]|uniref:GNAT family N-acetyltransferase n=1 Tax=Yoonia rhodophyticola TaxID=3137370 RepID=A0AAN0MAD2_9RHOB
MMQIERIYEADLTPADEVLINRLLVRAFDEGFGDRSYHQQRHYFRLIMRDADAIIGHMALCYRAIRMGARLVNIMGLAEVATDPDEQGKGIGSALMKAAIAETRKSQADFFLLFGVRPMYAGNGFCNVSNPISYVDFYHARMGNIHHTDDHALMVLKTGDLDWDDQAHIDLLGHNF